MHQPLQRDCVRSCTFIVSSRESSPEGSPSAGLSVGDLLQIDQVYRQRLPVNVERLTPVSVLDRSAQDQCQLEEEHVKPLEGANNGLVSVFSTNTRSHKSLIFFFLSFCKRIHNQISKGKGGCPTCPLLFLSSPWQ